jgi:helix-turn-helix protein
MTKYETTQDILDYFNPAKRLEKAEATIAKMTIAKEKERLRLAKERQEKEQERQEKERLRLEKSILLMLSKGIDADLVAETIGIPKSEVLDIYNKNKN